MFIAIGAIGAPLLAVVAAIAAATAAAVAFWPEIVRVKDAIMALARDGLEFLRAEFERTVTFWRDLPAKFMEIGRDIIAGLLDGLREKWAEVKAWFVGLGDAIPEWVRERLGIQSPSKVFAEIGANIMQGLGMGIESETGAVRSGVQSFASDIAGQLKGILSGAVKWRGALANVLEGAGGRLIDSGISGLGTAIGIPGFAGGTANTGGLRGQAVGIVHGQEAVIPLPNGGKIPVMVSGRSGGGSVVMNFSPNIDARGADAGAVARLENAMRSQAAQFESRVIDTVRTAGKRGMV